MVVLKENEIMDDKSYCVRNKGGRNLIEKRPIFSPDGQSLLVICINTVLVYDVKTSECVRTLDTDNDTEKLVSIAFPPDEDYNLYGFTEDGYIIQWTWQTGVILRKKKIQLQLDRILTFDIIDNNSYLVTYLKAERTYLAKLNFKSEHVERFIIEDFTYTNIWSVAIGGKEWNRFVAICNGSATLHIHSLVKLKDFHKHKSYNKIRLVCVTSHPSGECIATGDALGRAYVWHGDLFDNNVGTELFHWHALPVTALAFSQPGSYLLTGGNESVLVKWLTSTIAQTAREKFLIPRMPGEIRHITISSMNIAVSTSNNSIIILNPELHPVRTIVECGGISVSSGLRGTGLQYHRPTASLLLPGSAGQLTMFSTNSNQVLYNIDVTSMNPIPATRFNPRPINMEVSCSATSANGDWLVTSEYRSDIHTCSEERLKFWSFDSGSEGVPYTLNTCVSFSHGGCEVTYIKLDPKATFCVTAGADNKFRIWIREEHRLKQGESWICFATCYYALGPAAFLSSENEPALIPRQLSKYDSTGKEVGLTYLKSFDIPNNAEEDVLLQILGYKTNLSESDRKDLQTNSDMGGIAISEDASLIAVWFGSKLTLWDSYAASVKTVLSHPVLRPKGVDVCFSANDAAQYLACTTVHCLAVWNLLSLSMKWVVNIQPSTLVADPFSNKMAATTVNNDVFVFTPHSSTPLINKKTLLPVESGKIQHTAFAPTEHHNQTRLYILRNIHEIFCLEPKESTAGSNLEVLQNKSNFHSSNFSALLATQRISEVQRNTATSARQHIYNMPVLEYFSGAAYTMPPLTTLCTPFLQSLAGVKKKPVKKEKKNEDLFTVDSSSDEEDEVIVVDEPKDDESELVRNMIELKSDLSEKDLVKIKKEPFKWVDNLLK